MKKKVGACLRRIALYNVTKKVLRPIHRASWRRRACSLYGKFVGSNDLCFDIGAHHGSRSDIFLQLGARVVSVEPLQTNMEQLRRKFGGNSSLTLVHKGVASNEGKREIYFSETATDVASMSPDWIEVAKKMDRLKNPIYNWEQKVVIPVTTLDKLIEEHGTPQFCKIDVEGFESEVLAGLSTPISALSFEYTPECIEKSIDCVDLLEKLGAYEFNYSICETMELELTSWVDARRTKDILNELSKVVIHGDIYARIRR